MANEMQKITPLQICGLNGGSLPSAFDDSLSYYESLRIVMCKLNEVIKFVDDVITREIVAYIDRRFDDIMIDAIYDEPTETLNLTITHEKR